MTEIIDDNLLPEPDEDLDIEDDLEVAESIPDAPVERFRFVTDKGQSLVRIDKFLMGKIEGATRNKIQQAIEEGKVTVDGNMIKSNFKIKPDMEVVVMENRRPDKLDILPEKMDLNIVYEDDALMVINKPAGMVVHPGSGNYSGTLVNGIAWYLNPPEDKMRILDLPRVGLVHRIDKDTSGLVLIAKTEHAMKHLAMQFAAHTIHRRYIALAWGNFEEQQEGTIIAHVGRHQRLRKIMDAYPEGEYGKHAITHYKVLEQFHYVSLLEFRLETGRTHQIRVHAKYLGHPLFNDLTYGGDRIVKGTVYTKYKQFVDNCMKICKRQALHAKEIGFVHPVTNEMMKFDSEIPDDIANVIVKWRNYIATANTGVYE